MHWNWASKTFFLLLGLVTTFLLGLWVYFVHFNNSETTITFLAVGEGDALLISQGSEQILIDGGREGNRLLSHLGRHVPFYDHTIEAVIETHPDADHIGGFPELFRHYYVGTFLSTGAKSDTATVKLLDQNIATLPVDKRLPAIEGTNFTFSQGGELDILFPSAPVPVEVPETNRTSVVARFTYGATSFLFTGDLPDEEEYVSDIKPITVLKVAHHGSHYSTSDHWLDLVQPKEAIISVGSNTYGHPSQPVLDRLTAHGARIFRTDEMGDIVYHCRAEWQGCRRDGE